MKTDYGQKCIKAWRTLAKGLCANSSLWCHQVFDTRQAHFNMGWSEPGR